jgi:hypothetical protein
LIIYSLHGYCPSPFLQSSRHPTLFPSCSFQFLVYYSIFFTGQVSVCSGGYACLSQGWLWEYHVLLICSPVGLCLPRRLRPCVWQCSSPPGFSVYCGVGKLCAGWGFGGIGVMPPAGDFFCQVCLQHLSKILLYGAHIICFLSLVAILEPLPCIILTA